MLLCSCDVLLLCVAGFCHLPAQPRKRVHDSEPAKILHL